MPGINEFNRFIGRTLNTGNCFPRVKELSLRTDSNMDNKDQVHRYRCNLESVVICLSKIFELRDLTTTWNLARRIYASKSDLNSFLLENANELGNVSKTAMEAMIFSSWVVRFIDAAKINDPGLDEDKERFERYIIILEVAVLDGLYRFGEYEYWFNLQISGGCVGWPSMAAAVRELSVYWKKATVELSKRLVTSQGESRITKICEFPEEFLNRSVLVKSNYCEIVREQAYKTGDFDDEEIVGNNGKDIEVENNGKEMELIDDDKTSSDLDQNASPSADAPSANAKKKFKVNTRFSLAYPQIYA